MQKSKHSVLRQRKTACSSRRNILLQKIRRKILRRNNAYFLACQDHTETAALLECQQEQEKEHTALN